MFRVMTFNLRFENDVDGENHWRLRRDLLVRTILRYRPHVLGTQEGKPSQLHFLSEELKEYKISAASRHWDDYCQYPTLYYRTDHFDMVTGGEFWLSETPDVHLSKSWDSAFPRMLSYACLEIKNTQQKVWFLVTHLDHVSERARIESSKIIFNWTRSIHAPIVLMGDFNALPGSQVHRILRESFHDTWEVLGWEEDHHSYTHHGFTGIPDNGRIDWILATPDFRIVDAAVARDQEKNRYPSDHFPYWVDFEEKISR